MPLTDKVCLVTDCAAMDGPALAAEFLEQGARVVLQTPDLALARRELEREKVPLDRVRLIHADFGERGVAEREIAKVVDETGRLDVLVSNSARPHRKGGGEPFVDMDDAEMDAIVHKLVLELLYTTRAAVRHMLTAGRGRIVSLGSTGAVVGFGLYVPYCAARSAAVGLTLALAKEVAARGICVNAIVQNYIENRTYFRDEQLVDAAFMERMRAQVPVGRLGTAREIAKLAAFLASDDAGFITGEIIRVGGGTALSA